MQSKPKSNSVVTHRITEDGSIVFDVIGAGSVEFNPKRVSTDNRERAERHGWIQRVSDAAAIGRNPETGKPATPQEKLARMTRLVDHYHTGTSDWSMVKAGDGTGAAGYLFRALCRLFPNRNPDEISAELSKMSKTDQATLRAHKPVADIIAVIKAEEPADEEGAERAEDLLARLQGE